MTQYHVSPSGLDTAVGDATNPLRTINRAAQLAQPGDEVIVHEGTYHESIDPARGGVDENHRITYRAAEGETRPVITGSDEVKGWEQVDGDVYKLTLPDSYFGSFNPFTTIIFGDWLEQPRRTEKPHHVAEVLINSHQLYEVTSKDELANPPLREMVEDYVTHRQVPVFDAKYTQYVWMPQHDDKAQTTTIFANFHGENPNEQTVEITTRPTLFFPSRHHINYITVDGFEFKNVATQFAPPTAHQVGAVGPNWAYGWKIINNVIHDSKAVGICLGTSDETGDNEWFRTNRKTGFQYQFEAVFKALRIGWRKGVVGSHYVANNTIYDCGQAAIVGHMGGAFSLIEDNHIYRAGARREFFGWEVAGIKLHAALDTCVRHNYIHDCSLGMWLDWQAQGTRVSSNVFEKNCRDLMVEVSHGPLLVDNNAFLSAYTFDDYADASAFVNNLISGKIVAHQVLDRFTPYHFPHSTEPAGAAFVCSGDDKFSNNIFCNMNRGESAGLSAYESYPNSMEEYLQGIADLWATGTISSDPLPVEKVIAHANVYADNLAPSKHEKGGMAMTGKLEVTTKLASDGLHLLVTVPQELADFQAPRVSTPELGTPRIVEERYENPDGSDLVLDTDLAGQHRKALDNAGPLAGLHAGLNDVVVWKA